MNDYTFEEIAKALEGIDPGVSLVIADLPAAYDRIKLNGRWCVKAELNPAYNVEDLEDIFKEIADKLDEYCLKTEQEILIGKFWLLPVVEIWVEHVK
jgi:hypothetical protein